MPYLLRHYEQWVQKMIFYDAGSTDGTREIIEACPMAELRGWTGCDELDDAEILQFSNERWKEARGRADWVAWIDADEFLYHPQIRDVLWRYLKEGVTVPFIDGYTMVSERPPKNGGQIYDEIRTGFPDLDWGKPVLFQPSIEMTFYPGRHAINEHFFKPVRSAAAEIKLLHYRALGMDYLRARHKRNWARVPDRCKHMNLGTNCDPDHTGHHGISWFAQMLQRKWGEVI